MTFETFDQSVEGTWHEQQKDNDKDKYKDKNNDKDKYIQRTPSTSDPRDLWPLRHLIRVMRGHDLINKNTMIKTNVKIMTMTKTNTFKKHIQRATLETCDLQDIWSEWREDMTWPTKRQRHIQRQRQIHLESTFKEHPSDLWHMRHWLHFWQLRTWIHDNLCCLTIKSDTGQHSQFLRCFYFHSSG